MRKEHISVETSKLLDKFRDTDTFFRYFGLHDPSWYIPKEDRFIYNDRSDEDIQTHTKDVPDLCYTKQPIAESYLAPVHSKVRSFLRNEYSIHISIQPYMLSDMSGSKLRYNYEIMRQLGPKLHNYKFESGFSSYEDCIDRSLQISLAIASE